MSQHVAEVVHTYTLCAGSNSAQGREILTRTLAYLHDIFCQFQCSDIYVTAAVGCESPDYMNAVCSGCSTLSPSALNRLLKLMEAFALRMRGIGIVTLDIDIVMADGKVCRPKDFKTEYFQIGYRQLHP